MDRVIVIILFVVIILFEEISISNKELLSFGKNHCTVLNSPSQLYPEAVSTLIYVPVVYATAFILLFMFMFQSQL